MSGQAARRVRALRRRLGLTQQQLAFRVGVQQKTVSAWETGKTEPTSTRLRMLELLEAGALGAPGESEKEVASRC